MVGGSPMRVKRKSAMQRKRVAALNTAGSYARSHISLLAVYIGCGGMPVMSKRRLAPTFSSHQRICATARVSIAVMKR